MTKAEILAKINELSEALENIQEDNSLLDTITNLMRDRSFLYVARYDLEESDRTTIFKVFTHSDLEGIKTLNLRNRGLYSLESDDMCLDGTDVYNFEIFTNIKNLLNAEKLEL